MKRPPASTVQYSSHLAGQASPALDQGLAEQAGEVDGGGAQSHSCLLHQNLDQVLPKGVLHLGLLHGEAELAVPPGQGGRSSRKASSSADHPGVEGGVLVAQHHVAVGGFGRGQLDGLQLQGAQGRACRPSLGRGGAGRGTGRGTGWRGGGAWRGAGTGTG